MLLAETPCHLTGRFCINRINNKVAVFSKKRKIKQPAV
jgi:hypothetical protein